jgi:hypothetical protein
MRSGIRITLKGMTMIGILPRIFGTCVFLFSGQTYAQVSAPIINPASAPSRADVLVRMAKDYPWLTTQTQSMPPLVNLFKHYPTPAGYTRIDASDNHYARWLRTLPVRTDRTNVLSYRGQPLVRPSSAIVMLDVGTRDLQQCADSAIRLHAEYLWSRKKTANARYHFTSGQVSSWRGWLSGDRFKIVGRRLEKRQGKRRPGTHQTYRQWLTHLFIYAGTQSLRFDSDPVGDKAIEGGDFFVQPGGPGHAVVVLDVATNHMGDRIALIGQGFMPAEDFHVLRAAGTIESVWFRLPSTATETMRTPSWPRPFKGAEARRFKTPK